MRTIGDYPEWKYVKGRWYLPDLQRSVEQGTQWAVFEINGDALWANVWRVGEDPSFKAWKMDGLPGIDAKEAFVVRCDRAP